MNPRLFISICMIIVLGACNKAKPSAEKDPMLEFAENYTRAWNSSSPDSVVAFYNPDGILKVNSAPPAFKRPRIRTVVESYMLAFPDMKLTMDSLVADGIYYRYHWTFEGTNTGLEGTGNAVKFSGFERWTMDEETGLIHTSIGTYDAEDYVRQLKGDTEADQ